LAAGIIHGGAIGLHVEHPQLARIFIVTTLLQVGWGLTMLLAPRAVLIPAGVLINGAAVGGWLLTRIAGVSWIDGLEVAESPQWADSICAGLGAIAATTALAAMLIGSRPLPSVRLTYPAMACAVLVVPAMWTGSTHVHNHSSALTASGVVDESQPHGHSDEAAIQVVNVDGSTTETTAHPHSTDWPRAYDPAVGLDISGVDGVSAEQEARARALIEDTLDQLPRWADYDDAVSQGWVSIGDESTGFEHLINRRLIFDDKFLDPSAPEALVYKAEGSKRTLVSAMFMANFGVAYRRSEAHRLRGSADAVARARQSLLPKHLGRALGRGRSAGCRRQVSDRFGTHRWRLRDGPRLDRRAPVRTLRGSGRRGGGSRQCQRTPSVRTCANTITPKCRPAPRRPGQESTSPVTTPAPTTTTPSYK